MQSLELFEEFRKNAEKNNSVYAAEYSEIAGQILHSTEQYKDDPIDFLYQPMFFSNKELELFESLTAQLNGILSKVIRRYLTDENFRGYFGFSPLLEKLILKDPGYRNAAPIGRFDIFYHYDTGSFQFCELNADGSAGMLEQRELARIFRQSSMIKDFAEDYEIKDFELFDSWVRILEEKYREFSSSSVKPQVAILDWMGENPPAEFAEFQKAFEAGGCKAIIADPRWLEYRDGKLYYQSFRIDCIYRRAVTWEVIERAASIQPFIDAYLAGDVCVVGPLRSQIIHNKIIFALLHDEAKTPFLTDEERNFIKKHIPYTAVFDLTNQKLVQGTIENKDLLVLKPMDKYASKGVRIGRDYSSEEWIRIITEEAKEAYIVQELCRVPRLPMAVYDSDRIQYKNFNYIIGLFMYDGGLQGIYTRAATRNVIGGIEECYVVPNFVFSKKNMI